MTRHFISTLAAAALAGTFALAQQTTPPQTTPQQPPPDITVIGCVTQGSSPTVFLLGNAKVKPEDRTELAKTYLLVAGTEDLMLKSHMGHEISVTGQAENKIAPVLPPGQTVPEKDLPKFTVNALTMVADRCTTAVR